MADVVDITHSARLVVAPDPFPSDPRVHGECITGVYTPPYAALWGYNVEGPPALYDYPGRIVEAFDLFSQDQDADRAAAILERWSMVTHGLVLRRFENSFWFCDRNMFEHLHGGPFDREHQEAVIEAEHSHYGEYERGAAVVVTLQRLAKFKRVTPKTQESQDDLLEVWENVGYIGDVYLEEKYQPIDVAHEFFFGSMTRKEQTILTAMLDERQVQRKSLA